MLSEQRNNEDGVGLFDFFDTLLKQRIVVGFFTLFGVVSGFIYALSTDDTLRFSILLEAGEDRRFVSYSQLNNFLANNGVKYSIDSNAIFSTFQAELSQQFLKRSSLYELLEIDDKVKQTPRSADLEDSIKFNVIPDKKYDKAIRIELSWDDKAKGKLILERLLKETEKSVKSGLMADIESIRQVMEEMRQLDAQSLRNKLGVMRHLSMQKLSARLLFLQEQYDIAKEIELAENSLVGTVLDSGSLRVVGSARAYEVAPYYFRGYNAIGKEISQLKARTPEQQVSLEEKEYFQLLSEQMVLETSIDDMALRNGLNAIARDNTIGWVRYNTEKISINNEIQKLIVSILLIMCGTVVGVIVALFRRTTEKKVR